MWVVVIVTKELRGNETEKLLKELVVGGGGGRRYLSIYKYIFIFI